MIFYWFAKVFQHLPENSEDFLKFDEAFQKRSIHFQNKLDNFRIL